MTMRTNGDVRAGAAAAAADVVVVVGERCGKGGGNDSNDQDARYAAQRRRVKPYIGDEANQEVKTNSNAKLACHVDDPRALLASAPKKDKTCEPN